MQVKIKYQISHGGFVRSAEAEGAFPPNARPDKEGVDLLLSQLIQSVSELVDIQDQEEGFWDLSSVKTENN